MSFADEMDQQLEREWKPFSTTELLECLNKTSNFSAPGLDHISWYWLRKILTPVVENEDQDEQPTRDLVPLVTHLFSNCIKHSTHPTAFKLPASPYLGSHDLEWEHRLHFEWATKASDRQNSWAPIVGEGDECVAMTYTPLMVIRRYRRVAWRTGTR